MNLNKLVKSFSTYGEHFLIGDSLSWGLMIGSSDRHKNGPCDVNFVEGKKMAFETHTRAWIKSIVWRLFGIVILGAISWIITRSWREMSMITILFHSVRVVLYYLHERIWERIHWGRIKHPLSVLPVKKDLTPEDLKLIRNQLKNLGYLD
jgi:uncharacterized membrane protein